MTAPTADERALAVVPPMLHDTHATSDAAIRGADRLRAAVASEIRAAEAIARAEVALAIVKRLRGMADVYCARLAVPPSWPTVMNAGLQARTLYGCAEFINIEFAEVKR